ncbi:hypothetical protein EDB87DRAFT_1828977 [Lactarius vividus]|nr:hypothetical protein EDB87DRAFT_1828977 [Lactarius vividus]
MLNRISVNEPDFQISLLTTHTLLGNSTEITLPFLLDARFIGTVLFSFSGTVDQSTPVPPVQMLHSSAIKTFLHYLTANAGHLCISTISEVILGDRSLGSPEVSATLSRSADIPSSCAHVLSIRLTYNWTSLRQQSAGLSIFSPQILLPFQPALNKLVHKLFSAHIVGRYPWLFGSLRTKLYLELQWFPSLVRSLLAITARSENMSFRSESQELLKRIHNKASIYKRVVGDMHLSLFSQRGCPSDSPAVEASDDLVLALEIVLKIAARSPPFKGACCLAASKRCSSDDETLNFSGHVFYQPSQDFSGDTLSWDDFVPSEVRFSDYGAPEYEENIWSGESEEDMPIGGHEPYSTPRAHSSEGSRPLISEKSLTCQSNCDSGVRDEDENQYQFIPTDMSPLLAPEWDTRMRMHACPPCCENFTAPDHDPGAQSDLCIFDNDMDGMLLAFD